MAKKFRFTLDVVRRIRQQAQNAQKRVVADAVRAVATTQEQISRTTRELKDTIDHSRSFRDVARPDLALLRGNQVYRGYLHRRILESQEELAARKKKLADERKTLAETTKQLKVIEKLREKRWMRYLAEVRREEQAGYDESAAQSYMRKRAVQRDEARRA